MFNFLDTIGYTKKARDEGEGRHGNVETKLLDVLLGTGPHTRNCRAYQMPTITGQVSHMFNLPDGLIV